MTWPHTSGRWTCEQAPPPALMTPPTLQPLPLHLSAVCRIWPDLCSSNQKNRSKINQTRAWEASHHGFNIPGAWDLGGRQTLVNIKLIYWFLLWINWLIYGTFCVLDGRSVQSNGFGICLYDCLWNPAEQNQEIWPLDVK